jgi:hypothetical protein
MLISVKSYLRLLLPFLLGLLASCTVYDNIFHPYRLPSPPMSKDAKAKARAAEKARHKGIALKPAEEETDAITPAATGNKASSTNKDDKKLTYSELPTGTKLKYDKQLLLKKPKLKRRQYHHYETHPLKPTPVNRESRRLRRHSKGKDKERGKASSQPNTSAPDEGMTPPTEPTSTPTPAPEPKAKKEEKVKEDKPKAPKGKKALIPKPDPTQQATDH